MVPNFPSHLSLLPSVHHWSGVPIETCSLEIKQDITKLSQSPLTTTANVPCLLRAEPPNTWVNKKKKKKLNQAAIFTPRCAHCSFYFFSSLSLCWSLQLLTQGDLSAKRLSRSWQTAVKVTFKYVNYGVWPPEHFVQDRLFVLLCNLNCGAFWQRVSNLLAAHHGMRRRIDFA